MFPPTAPASMPVDSLENEMRHLAQLPNITAAQNARLEQLLAEHAERTSARSARLANIRSQTTERHSGCDPNVIVRKSSGEIFHAEARTRGESVDLALRAIDEVERNVGREVRPDVRRHIETRPEFAESFRAKADPNYASAFAKLLIAGDHGRATFQMTDLEHLAVQRVAAADARAMALSPDTSGGVAVPVLLDTVVTINNTGTVGRVRDLATIVTGISDTWRGINSAGVTAEWLAEGAESADASPTLNSNDITAHKASAFIPFSIELESDWQGLLEQIRRMLADAKDRLENEAFINGDGSGKPYGITNRLDASTTTEVIVASAGTLTAADLLNVFAQVPPRYRQNAGWLMSLDVANQVRLLGDDKLGNFTANLTEGYGFQLLGRPMFENSSMPDFTTGTSAGVFTVVGDVSQYVIFDRADSLRVEIVPHLMHASNGRPSGQRGVYAFWRVGGDLVSGAASTEPGMRALINKTS